MMDVHCAPESINSMLHDNFSCIVIASFLMRPICIMIHVIGELMTPFFLLTKFTPFIK